MAPRQEQNDAESIWVARLDPVVVHLLSAPERHVMPGQPFFGAVKIS